jgi:2-aminoadipate transaminase
VGYLVGPPGLIASLRRRATETYISPNMVAQSIVADFCHSGAIERSVATVKEALRERRNATCEALERHLPEARFVSPEGGYFLWVDLPEGSDVAALERGAAERGVLFVKGTDFLLKGGDSSLRLAYSAVPPDQIEEGIARVGEAYRELSPTAA